MNNKLREIRERAGYSANKVAELTGLSICTIFSLENGKNNIQDIKFSTLIKLCDILKTTPYELFDSEELLTFSKKRYCKKYSKKLN